MTISATSIAPQQPQPQQAQSNRPSMSKNKTRTKDKYRVVYNDQQRIELENEFKMNEYIAIPRKQEIAHKLNLSERQIKIWFQNRRAKKRKQQKRKQSVVSTTTTSATLNIHHHQQLAHHCTTSSSSPISTVSSSHQHPLATSPQGIVSDSAGEHNNLIIGSTASGLAGVGDTQVVEHGDRVDHFNTPTADSHQRALADNLGYLNGAHPYPHHDYHTNQPFGGHHRHTPAYAAAASLSLLANSSGVSEHLDQTTDKPAHPASSYSLPSSTRGGEHLDGNRATTDQTAAAAAAAAAVASRSSPGNLLTPSKCERFSSADSSSSSSATGHVTNPAAAGPAAAVAAAAYTQHQLERIQESAATAAMVGQQAAAHSIYTTGAGYYDSATVSHGLHQPQLHNQHLNHATSQSQAQGQHNSHHNHHHHHHQNHTSHLNHTNHLSHGQAHQRHRSYAFDQVQSDYYTTMISQQQQQQHMIPASTWNLQQQHQHSQAQQQNHHGHHHHQLDTSPAIPPVDQHNQQSQNINQHPHHSHHHFGEQSYSALSCQTNGVHPHARLDVDSPYQYNAAAAAAFASAAAAGGGPGAAETTLSNVIHRTGNLIGKQAIYN